VGTKTRSPLRYPGAKRALVPILQRLVDGPVPLLVEPFCGGASFSLACLADGLAERVVLADADPLVAAFWQAASYHSDDLIARLRIEPVTLKRWDYWRATEPVGVVEKAVKALFLNRTSFSGIMHAGAGPIGGRAQSGPYRIGCRWSLAETVRSIEWIGALGRSGRIVEAVCADWRDTLRDWATDSSVLVYCDPPYVGKGQALYSRAFDDADHQALAEYLIAAPFRWLLTYDDHPLIRRLYGHRPGLGRYLVDHSYSAAGSRSSAARATELVITDRPVPGCGLMTWGVHAAPFGFRRNGEPRKRRPGPGRPPLPPEERAARRAASSRRWREAHRDAYAAYMRAYRPSAARLAEFVFCHLRLLTAGVGDRS